MSITSLPTGPSSVRSLTSRLVRRRRSDRGLVDRNTSPTDFVLRDYRYVR